MEIYFQVVCSKPRSETSKSGKESVLPDIYDTVFFFLTSVNTRFFYYYLTKKGKCFQQPFTCSL